MGYLVNVALSVPMAIIIYLLTEKLILSAVAERKFDEKVQSNFIIGFVVGLAFIALAMSAFAEKGVFDNQSMQLAMYGAGGFLVLNSVFFSWDVLDENTKMLILTIAITGLMMWTYTLKRSKVPKKKNNKKLSSSNNTYRYRLKQPLSPTVIKPTQKMKKMINQPAHPHQHPHPIEQFY